MFYVGIQGEKNYHNNYKYYLDKEIVCYKIINNLSLRRAVK